MPEYTVLAGAYLVVAGAAAIRAGLHRKRAAWLALGVFGAATIVFDLVLTSLPIVTYGPEATSRIALGPMPVEDLAYGLALCLTAIVSWTKARPGGVRR